MISSSSVSTITYTTTDVSYCYNMYPNKDSYNWPLTLSNGNCKVVVDSFKTQVEGHLSHSSIIILWKWPFKSINDQFQVKESWIFGIWPWQMEATCFKVQCTIVIAHERTLTAQWTPSLCPLHYHNLLMFFWSRFLHPDN